MAEEKRITISRTLNGDTIYHIARNSGGQIIARELTLEKLEAAIKTYKEPPAVKEEEPADEEKKFLTNKLSKAVQEKKEEQAEKEEKSPKKKSFWDKLK